MAFGIVYDARLVPVGNPHESACMATVTFHTNVHAFARFAICTHVSFDFEARNGNDTILVLPLPRLIHHVPATLLEASILSVLPTAVKLTREGDAEVRELATGSTTSSRVIELMSHSAYHAHPAHHVLISNPIQTAVAEVVNSETPLTNVALVVEIIGALHVSPQDEFNGTISI